jgi:glycosyltransferase involved in cell wall biosynthesis
MRLGLLTSVGRTLDFFPEMIETWRKAGVEVFPAAGTPPRIVEAEIIRGLTQSPRPVSILAPVHLRQWIRRRELDVVVTNTAVASALVRTTPTPTPIVYFCHGLHWSSAARFQPWSAVEALLAKRTLASIVLNEDDREWMVGRLGADRVAKLPYGIGVPVEAFPRSAPPDLDGTVRLAWLGDFTPRKRPQLAVDVARRLAASGLDFVLTMGGDGPLRSTIGEEVQRSGLGARVLTPGRVDTAALLKGSHAVVHTATWEGLSRVLLEAAAVGRNSYGFDVKGVRDAPGVRVVPDGDSAALAQALSDDLARNLPAQDFPPAQAMSAERQAELVLQNLRRWLAGEARGVAER